MENKNSNNQTFNMNNILSTILSYGSWLIVIASVIILGWLSFVTGFDVNIDWKVLGIFTIATVGLSWVTWNNFYNSRYQKVIKEDVDKQFMKKYSIHGRYHHAIKNWTEEELQKAIEDYNKRYTESWLKFVEAETGVPIETKHAKMKDPLTGEEKVIEIKGIKDLPYKKFKHKVLMWRIKNHKYPKSGYRSAMQLLSLLSAQDDGQVRRNINKHKQFYFRKSLTKLVVACLVVSLGGSLAPHIMNGEVWPVVLKLILAIGSIFSAVFFGMLNGVKGARIKLSLLEQVAGDLEEWAHIKPIISPYEVPVEHKPVQIEQPALVERDGTGLKVNPNIFDKLENQK